MNKQIRIMGVINANEDSFFKNSRFKNYEALKKIHEMIEDGANIIDIGGVSSRPGSEKVEEKEEYKRIENIISLIKNEKLYEKVDFSIDSYSPLNVKYALDAGFVIINDITALQNDEVCKLAAQYKVTVVLMHMQNNPQNMQNNPQYKNIIDDINDFFEKRIIKAKTFGINDLILDVGIGFGKKLSHNITLIKCLKEFKKHNYEILIAASRKSMINDITPCEIKDRLPGTLAVHLEAIKNGATLVRCHDVKEHFQAIKVYEALNS